MNILALDTCFDACSVCLARARDGTTVELSSALERFESGHAERLAPMIAAVMRRAGMAFSELDRVAVTVGPGTFTGTRIGVAAARGLALATGVEVAGATSLAVMAEIAAGTLGANVDLMIAVDARRGEVYAQLFAASGKRAIEAPQVLSIEDAARLGGSIPVRIAGSGAEAVAQAAVRSGRRATACMPTLLPEASALARMASSLSPTQTLQPLYLRPPDAKPQEGKAIARAQP